MTEEKNSSSIPWRKKSFLYTQGIKFLQFHSQEENLCIYHPLCNQYKKWWWNWLRNRSDLTLKATADGLDSKCINSAFKIICKHGEEGISFLLP